METTEILTATAEIIGILVVIGTITVFIVRWGNGIIKRISKIESKIESLPSDVKYQMTEVENKMIRLLLPFATSVINAQNNPLSPEEIIDMRRLMTKLQNNTITVDESEILRGYLEIERSEAERNNNSNLILAIGIALAAIALIAVFTNRE